MLSLCDEVVGGVFNQIEPMLLCDVCVCVGGGVLSSKKVLTEIIIIFLDNVRYHCETVFTDSIVRRTTDNPLCWVKRNTDIIALSR